MQPVGKTDRKLGVFSDRIRFIRSSIFPGGLRFFIRVIAGPTQQVE